MKLSELGHTIRRYRTLKTNVIHALPVVILMPHSACNCRCIMCDIWKNNKNLRQLNPADIKQLITALIKFGTRQVVMSGGEAMLNPNFFTLCEIIRRNNIRITLLSTGLTLEKNASHVLALTNEVIVSLDGDEETHNRIRNIPDAFGKLREGVFALKNLDPSFRITARSVIQRQNFRVWKGIIESAKEIGLDQVSFLPADVSSHAFNRQDLWDAPRQHEVLPGQAELPELQMILEEIIARYDRDFKTHFIAESPQKLRKIYDHYAACYALNPFPSKKCNAPWVSAVIEADGTVRPCFFHDALGNIHDRPLENILNDAASIRFRENLDLEKNETCKKCVCYLNLKATAGFD